MNATVRTILRAVTPGPLRRRARAFAIKARNVTAYDGMRRNPAASLRYLASDHEFDNFTYEIANSSELASFVADLLGADASDVLGYVNELQEDHLLEAAVRERLAGRRDRNPRMPFGRRLGWYAIARVIKPRLVVETGVHDGLGSIALLRALDRNQADGHPGRLLSIDIDPSAGWLIPESLRSRHDLIIGDALVDLPTSLAGRQVELFIHDSDHRYEHESAEFSLITEYLGRETVLISDNAHSGTAFPDFCHGHGLDLKFWREAPRNHFYPGAGIGAAVVFRDLVAE